MGAVTTQRPETSPQSSMVVLDLEGVLVPEIWIAVADRVGIEALRRTTRDEPDYDVLMRGRLDLLHQRGITLSQIAEVIGGLRPLPGALDFLDTLRTLTQVVILSDTFEEFAQPLMAQLGYPTILCHRLLVEDDVITGYHLRQPDQKRSSVEAFQSLRYRVVAAGDSYNDLSMLTAADVAFWFRAPAAIAEAHPEFPAVSGYDELARRINHALLG